MKKVAATDAVFVAVFALFIALPNLHFSRAEVSTKENRTLAAFKPLFVAGHFNESFPSDFEAFYADRFFGREALLALSQSLTSRFVVSKQTTGNVSVLIGQEGWLFYRGDNSERNFMNIDYFTDEQLSSILRYLTDIKSFCDTHGKRFVFFIAPAKNKIYGEYYPVIIKKQNPDTASRAFQLIDYIKQNSDVTVVYPYERLLSEKERGDLLYYKNDTHWNELGSYIGYEELCRALGVEPMEVSEYKTVKNVTGDLTNMFPVSSSKDYRTIYRLPKIERSYSQVEKPDALPYVLNDRSTSYYTECAGKKLNAVFYCDSMTWVKSGLINYVSNTFATVNYFRRKDIRNTDIDILNQADIVVLQQAERGLPGLAAHTFPTFD